MATSRSKRPAVNEDLQMTIDRLEQRLEVLTAAVDELTDQLEWRTNRDRREDSSSPLVMLRSMPVDPTTDDWHLNRVSADEVQRLRAQLTPTAASSPIPAPAMEQLCRETAELRQIVALWILIGANCCDLEESYDWLIEWSSREFEPELLRESLGDIPSSPAPPDPVSAPEALQPTPLPHGRQRDLFADTNDDD